jgi:hypothetical protein
VSALKSGVTVLNPLHAWPNRPSYELRLGKYASRGYAVFVPGIDKRRIDYNLIQQTNLGDLKGLARFIKVASEMDSAPHYKCERRIWQGGRLVRETVDRPRNVEEISNLRQETLNSRSADERLILATDFTDEEMYDDATDVIVPSIYPGKMPMFWTYTNENEYPLSHSSRDEAWEEIVDAGHDDERPDFLERRLIDAWDTEKRSREYLNGRMDQYDLTNVYYSHAYKDS